jgi:hypothetical protein
MASYPYHVAYQIVDFNGDSATMTVKSYAADTTTLAQIATNSTTIGTVLAAATNGKVIRRSAYVLFDVAQYLVGTTPPNNAEYSSVTDGARFNFGNAKGERVALTVPAPLEALFGVNSNVIDPLQTQSAAFIAAIEAATSGPDGVADNLYKGGVKVGRGARVRRSSLIP